MRLVTALLAVLLAIPGPAAANSPAPEPTSPASSVPLLGWEVVSRRPHDDTAFTQGLQLDAAGRLFESTGLHGESTLREVDPVSGEVLRIRRLPDEQFGEGLALVGDELIQLTWRRGLARRFEAETFELIRRHRYEGQGWGLCFDGQRLVMSDGSDELEFRDPVTFEVLGSVEVTLMGESLRRLNELECVADDVWANVWYSDTIVRIDPTDGRVTGVLDLSGIIEPHPADTNRGSVLNGIAYDAAADTFLVTGKRWPELLEIRVARSTEPT